MTTATQPTQSPAYSRPSTPHWPSGFAIPLAEFGKSLDDADLDEWFEAFAERNSDMAEYEISSTGHLLIRDPTGHPGSVYEIELAGELMFWARQNGGVTYGPSSRFILPDDSRFGPDAAWVREERRHELMLPDNLPFAHIAPDFVAEIRSPSNTDAELLSKIDLFLAHGTRLAWYIDAETRTVIKFRPRLEPEILHDPEYIDGDDDVLPGFSFAVRERIFDLFAEIEQQEEPNAAGEQGSPD
jgi:Uma2 family endonuclease